MRTPQVLFFALVLSFGLSAQYRGSPTPTASGSFGSVVFPGGSPATTPNATRGFGSVVNPGGGGPHLTVPGGVVPSFARPANGRTGRHTAPVTTYAYPVYVGGYGYNDGYSAEQGAGTGAGPQQQPPNVTVVMPPQPVTPVIINVGPGGGQYSTTTERQQGVYEPAYEPAHEPAHEPRSRSAVEEPAPTDEPQRYLIAFKDHTIYSAVAYWVDGDTLHYFTSGNTHNQVSVSLLDRALTERLNKESGVGFKIPMK